ncbi:restriction endonuclease subunit S [Flavobacterium sp. I-STPA6A]|uniref:restriction endonuclease subunit S n=1 Tax=Flavobacterium sp. I-STPA6A TaxID=2590450 RepID=UPI00131C284F|nr:restriction endonuclease subunit S [Flavobacterium sp. I-STPA6A]
MEDNINIPVGWHLKQVVEFASKMQSGGTPKSDNLEYYNGEIPFVAIDDLSKSNKYISKTQKKITNKGLINSSAWLVPKYSLLYSIYATLGVPRINLIEVATNQAILNILPNKKIISLEFLYYLLLEKRNTILSHSAHTTQSNLNAKVVKELEFVFPKSTVEQNKIAEILSKVDKAISETETIIEKFNRIKTGLKKDLFSKGIDDNGNVRYDDKDFKYTSWGKIPKNWICKPLGDCCYITKLAGYEFTKHIKYIDNGEIIALRAMNIKNEQLLLDDVQRISKNVSNYLVRSKLYNGDILITYIGAYIGDVVQIRENDKYHLAPNIAKIVAGNSLTSDFLENVLRTEIVRKQINALITTTANPSLTMGQIRKIQVFYPKDIEEQKRINSKLLNTNKYLENLKIELNKLKSIKTGLMQDLLSGKKRVTHLTN